MSAVAAAIGGGALIGGITSLIGAGEQSSAAQNAANTQAGAANNATQIQYDEFLQQQANEQPWLNAGVGALQEMQNPEWSEMPTQSQIMQYMDPSMQFQLQQGEAALQASAAARGQQFSGNTLEAINNYAQNYAQTGYQNAFNNYMTAQNTAFNRLATVAGYGQNANSMMSQAGQNYANNASQNTIGAANAQAGGMIGSANAWAGGLSGLGNSVSGAGNNWMQYSMLNNLMNKSSNYSGIGAIGGFGSPGTPDASQFGMPAYGGQVAAQPTFSLSGL